MEIGHQKEIKNHLLREAVKNHQQMQGELVADVANGHTPKKVANLFSPEADLEWLYEKPGELVRAVHISRFDEGTEKHSRRLYISAANLAKSMRSWWNPTQELAN